MIEGLNTILTAREQQYSRFNKATESAQNDAEALKLLFDYMEKSNKQIMSVCQNILSNQTDIFSQLESINKKLEESKL